MSRVRAIDDDQDWLFGKGKNDYRRDNSSVVQDINTRLSAFLGDCFFDTANGVDWFNLLGAKDQRALALNIASVILNTQDVTGILQLSINLSTTRVLSVFYRVHTIYSATGGTFSLDVNGIV